MERKAKSQPMPDEALAGDGARRRHTLNWARVEQLATATDDLETLAAHRLHLITARRWRSEGRGVPDELQKSEQLALLAWAGVAPTLRAAREAYDGRIALMKGPEIAMLYPTSCDRPFSDVDLLVEDAIEAQRALLAAGFVEIGEPEFFRNIHHLRPLALPDMPLAVEIHSLPKWPDSLLPPPVQELLEATGASRTGVDGIAALSPEHHAICLAAHAWGHEPLARVGDVVDVAAAADHCDGTALRAAAAAWGMSRILGTTLRCADALFGEGRRSTPQRTWARHLAPPRRRTVAGAHLTGWLAPFSAEPPRAATVAAARAFVRDLRPARGERWHRKLVRGARAIAHARVPRAEFDELLGEDAQIGNEVLERINARHPH